METPLINHNFHVITGGPGSGKSSLITALSALGYATRPEAGRSIIQDQLFIGGSDLPWADRRLFAELMLNWEMRSYREASADGQPVFFDRGIPDTAGYLHLEGFPIPEHIRNACRSMFYNSRVFLAPPWQAIYQQDHERKQSWEEAKATGETMIDIYTELGYEVVFLPLAPVEERVEFILNQIA